MLNPTIRSGHTVAALSCPGAATEPHEDDRHDRAERGARVGAGVDSPDDEEPRHVLLGHELERSRLEVERVERVEGAADHGSDRGERQGEQREAHELAVAEPRARGRRVVGDQEQRPRDEPDAVARARREDRDGDAEGRRVEVELLPVDEILARDRARDLVVDHSIDDGDERRVEEEQVLLRALRVLAVADPVLEAEDQEERDPDRETPGIGALEELHQGTLRDGEADESGVTAVPAVGARQAQDLALGGETELGDEALPLLGLDRADGVDEAAARLHEAKRRREDLLLGRDDLPLRLRRVAPARLGAAAEDARVRAGSVHEDGVEALAAEGVGTARVEGPRRDRAEAEAARRLLDLPEASGGEVGRDDRGLVARELGEVGRLAARSGAEVEDPLPGARVEEVRRLLGRRVLDHEQALAEGRALAEARAAALEEDDVRAEVGARLRQEVLRGEPLHELVGSDAARAQEERRRIVAGDAELRRQVAVLLDPGRDELVRVAVKERELAGRARSLEGNDGLAEPLPRPPSNGDRSTGLDERGIDLGHGVALERRRERREGTLDVGSRLLPALEDRERVLDRALAVGALLVDERVGSELEGPRHVTRPPLERAAGDAPEEGVDRPSPPHDPVDELARPRGVGPLETSEAAVELGLGAASPVSEPLERPTREREGPAHDPSRFAGGGPGWGGRLRNFFPRRSGVGKSRFTTS